MAPFSINDDQEILAKKVFILEDEHDIADIVCINLKKAGFVTTEFNLAENLIRHLKEEAPDLLILDLMLPDMDGIEVCKYLRKSDRFASLPIIMLTAKAEEIDKIIGLEIGADDYVTKPFSPRELVARVKAVLRRDLTSTQKGKVKINDILDIDFQKYEVVVSGQKAELTTTEFKILKLLLDRKGWVFSRNQILDYIDPTDKGVLDRTVDVHIKNLREKLKEAGKMIKNMRGIGYKFEDE